MRILSIFMALLLSSCSALTTITSTKNYYAFDINNSNFTALPSGSTISITYNSNECSQLYGDQLLSALSGIKGLKVIAVQDDQAIINNTLSYNSNPLPRNSTHKLFVNCRDRIQLLRNTRIGMEYFIDANIRVTLTRVSDGEVLISNTKNMLSEASFNNIELARQNFKYAPLVIKTRHILVNRALKDLIKKKVKVSFALNSPGRDHPIQKGIQLLKDGRTMEGLNTCSKVAERGDSEAKGMALYCMGAANLKLGNSILAKTNINEARLFYRDEYIYKTNKNNLD